MPATSMEEPPREAKIHVGVQVIVEGMTTEVLVLLHLNMIKNSNTK